MTPSEPAIALMLTWGAGIAFVLSVGLGLLFNALERAGRTKARRRLDRFGSRLDG